MKNTLLCDARRLRFWTQQELADKVGVTRQTILAIESAKYSPSLELAFRIARVFKIGFSDLLSWLRDRGGGLRFDA